MVQNSLYKCSICGDILRFRYQVGFANIPVNVYCPNCNSHIFGTIYIDDENIGIKESIKNASFVKEQKEPDYVVELACEFIVDKCVKAKDFPEYPISMFLRNDPFNTKRTKFRNKYFDMVRNKDNYILAIENIYNLLKTNQVDLLRNYLIGRNWPVFDSKDLMKIANSLDAVIASKHYANYVLGPAMVDGVFEKIHNIMEDVVPKINRRHPSALREFILFLNDNNYFDMYFQRIPAFLVEYIKVCEQLAPVYDVYNTFDKVDLTTQGISTLSIDSMAVIYKKGYETLCDSIDLLIGLYNINSNGTYDNFDEGLFDFKEKINKFGSKYNKYIYFADKSDDLSNDFKDKTNNIIRNAEGHDSITIDGLNQNVTFKNKNNKGNINSFTESFLEFGKQCIDLFSSVLYVWEYYYQLLKLKYVLLDKMNLNYFPQK